MRGRAQGAEVGGPRRRGISKARRRLALGGSRLAQAPSSVGRDWRDARSAISGASACACACACACECARECACERAHLLALLALDGERKVGDVGLALVAREQLVLIEIEALVLPDARPAVLP